MGGLRLSGKHSMCPNLKQISAVLASKSRWLAPARFCPLVTAGDRSGPLVTAGDRSGLFRTAGDRFCPLVTVSARSGPFLPAGDRSGPPYTLHRPPRQIGRAHV